ncbi:MAG: hypothetical protein BBJ57_10850 [Desulfobacterales bacterium PC51MH44]|nr:MAG: hypothetical protein BBJ57_10850 [Desulfobacterales bacterium PC51MH44]
MDINPSCLFCGESARYVYDMDEYQVYQCVSCGTGFVHPMPAGSALSKLYDGFLPDLNVKKMPGMLNIASRLFQQFDLEKGHHLKMLDIGSGGGYFCKAFEELNYGLATYVDLDPQSCRFAQKKLGLERVYNVDAMRIHEITKETYDFMYCRHLIEHMPDPTGFLLRIIESLNTGGIFVVQFPNGDSLEYFAYTHLNIVHRFNKIRKSNNFSALKTFRLMLFGKMLHGMDPPRHLWAVSRKGIVQWSKRNNISCKTDTRHLGDLPFSPGYFRKMGLKERTRDFIGQKLLAPIRGGTHLVATLRNR